MLRRPSFAARRPPFIRPPFIYTRLDARYTGV
jgi:hypothetical protein